MECHVSSPVNEAYVQDLSYIHYALYLLLSYVTISLQNIIQFYTKFMPK